MSDTLLRQTFHIYDPVSLDKIDQKLRVNVHSEGDWHLAVTAFIFRLGKDNEVEVLVQERSQYVDIAQKHFDQSLATQLIVEDQGDTEVALRRGLIEELNINDKHIMKIFKWNDPGDIYISKQYIDNPELWNREIVVNYCVMISPHVVIENNFKVKGIEWLPWPEFCDLVRMQPNNFTKSVRMYAVADSAASELNKVMYAMAHEETPKKFSKKMFYLSLYDVDVALYDTSIEVYKTNYTMRKIHDVSKLSSDTVKSIIFDEFKYKGNILT